MELDEEVGRLYGTPLDEFVYERDQLARRLTQEGDRNAAAYVKALRKPTVGAWALNQAVRRRRAETDALLATGQRLRAAHEDLLAGGDPAVLRETMEEERSLTSVLADCAEAIASETGKSGPALRDRVRATLHAAAVDEAAREELAAGRFVREREAVGLGPLGGELSAMAPPGAARQQPAAPAKGARSAAKRGRSAAKPQPADPRETPVEEPIAPSLPDPQLEDAEAALEHSREDLRRAEAEHAATLAVADSAREALQETEVAEREARRLVRELWREVAKQERRVDRLRPPP
ncbi:MAG: hypothetical protein QOE60_230 [Thermoleophilaceae bacterium]|nr:hypothetical protein [Thermoleophilaceae bacterium]